MYEYNTVYVSIWAQMHQQDSRRWSLRHRFQNSNAPCIRYTSTPTWSQAPSGMEVPQPTSPQAVRVHLPNQKSPSRAHVADRTVSSVRSNFPTILSAIVNQPVTNDNLNAPSQWCRWWLAVNSVIRLAPRSQHCNLVIDGIPEEAIAQLHCSLLTIP